MKIYMCFGALAKMKLKLLLKATDTYYKLGTLKEISLTNTHSLSLSLSLFITEFQTISIPPSIEKETTQKKQTVNRPGC